MVSSMAREGAQSNHYNSELNQSMIRQNEYLSNHAQRLKDANQVLVEHVNNLEDVTQRLTDNLKPSYEIEDEFKERIATKLETTRADIEHYNDMIRLNNNVISATDTDIKTIGSHETYLEKPTRVKQAVGNSLGFFTGLGFLTYGMPSKRNKKD